MMNVQMTELDALAALADEVETLRLSKLAAEVDQWVGIHRAKRACQVALTDRKITKACDGMSRAARTLSQGTKRRKVARQLSPGDAGYAKEQKQLEVQWLAQRARGFSGGGPGHKRSYETKGRS